MVYQCSSLCVLSHLLIPPWTAWVSIGCGISISLVSIHSYHLTPSTLSPALPFPSYDPRRVQYCLFHQPITDLWSLLRACTLSTLFWSCPPLSNWSLIFIPHTCLSSSHHSHLSPSLSNDDRLFAFSSLLRDLPDTDTETPPPSLSLFRSSTCVYRLIVHPPAITVALSPVLIDRYVAPLMDYGIRSFPIETESSCCLFLPFTVRGYSSLREERLERDLVWIPSGSSLPSSTRYSTECLHKPSGLVPVEEALIAWSWDKNIPSLSILSNECSVDQSTLFNPLSVHYRIPWPIPPPITTVLLRRPSAYSSQLLICPPHPTTRLPHFILCLVLEACNVCDNKEIS